MKKLERVTVRIEPETLAQLAQEAQRRHVTVAWLVREFILRGLAKRRRKK